MLLYAKSQQGQQNLNAELSDPRKREGWADQPPGFQAMVSISPHLSSFPGAGLLGAFGPGEFTERSARGVGLVMLEGSLGPDS